MKMLIKPGAVFPRGGARRWLALNAVLLAVVGVLSLTYPVQELSRRLSDLYFRFRRVDGACRDVTLVLIDDASLQRPKTQGDGSGHSSF